MAITSKDLLEFSRKFSSGANECEIRAAASRGFYSAFHACKPVANQLPVPILKTTKGEHELVIQAFLQVPRHGEVQKKAAQIGSNLMAARTLRRTADYSLAEDFSSEDAQEMIDLAVKIEELLNQFKPLFFK